MVVHDFLSSTHPLTMTYANHESLKKSENFCPSPIRLIVSCALEDFGSLAALRCTQHMRWSIHYNLLANVLSFSSQQHPQDSRRNTLLRERKAMPRKKKRRKTNNIFEKSSKLNREASSKAFTNRKGKDTNVCEEKVSMESEKGR